MLKQIMLRKKIEKMRAGLAELIEKQTSLTSRSAELEQAIGEANTDEEISTVEGEIETLDAEQKDLDEKKGKLEGDIADLEGELKDLEDDVPEPTPGGDSKKSKNTGGEVRMTNSRIGFFRNMPHEQRSELVARSEVKDFLNEVRELGKVAKTRAVSGSELTIPDVMLELVRDNLHRYSKLLSKINLRSLKGTSRQNISGAVPEGIWTEACATLNELAIAFNQIEVDGYKVGGFIPICNSTLEDSDLNLAAEILDAISQAIGLAADKAILFGTGKKMPTGIATRLAQAAKPEKWASKAPEWTDLRTTNILKVNPTGLTPELFFADLILKLAVARPNYATGGTFWAMNRKTRMTIMSKAITFNAAGAIVAGVNGTMPIEGGEIIELDFIADNDIIGGYGSLYLMVERHGMQLAQSEHVRFIEDETVFKGTSRYDGQPVFGESFVALNIANTNPTTTATFAPDNANPSDSYLKSIVIGSLDLVPEFDPATGTYTAATTDATNKITAVAAKDGAVIGITIDGVAHVNGATATWGSNGEKVVVITSKFGTSPAKVYTVTVTKS